MAKKESKPKRTSALNFDPDELIIIGLDTDDDASHHLYDERIHRKDYVPKSMVKNVEALGVIETVSVTKSGNQYIVVDGRRRVLAARKANKRLRKRGEEPLLVPALLKKGDEEGLMGILISGNEHRLDDDAITRAEKAQRLKDRGRNHTQIGEYFGVSGTAVGNWLKVLDCVSEVKNSVRASEISMSAAIELSDMDPDEQRVALSEMISTGKTSVDDAKDRAGEGEGSGEGRSDGVVRVRPPKKTLIRKVFGHERAGKVLGNKFLMGALWAIGDVETGDIKGLPGLVEDVE